MACWLRLLACAATIALIYAVEDAHGSEPETTSAGSAPLRGCVATADQLTAAVNSSMGGMFDEVVVNCLAYEDSDRTLDLAILSAFAAGEDDGRYTVQCSNGLLLIQDSPHNASRSVVGCHECSDDQQVPQCASGGACSGDCVSCYGNGISECLACPIALYNNTCVDSCPGNTSPNISEGNNCACTYPAYQTAPDCECRRECSHEEPYLLPDNCSCVHECPHGMAIVVSGPAPPSVVGHPVEELPHLNESLCDLNEEQRRAALEALEPEEEEEEPGTCVATCPGNFLPDSHRVCYALGKTYCIEDNGTECTGCREGTLLNHGKCAGFYRVIEERNVDLECEELEEEHIRDTELLEIKILLPITTIGTLIIFIVFFVIAHFRYPHIGETKRHRKPNRKTVKLGEHEKTFRPQSTVRYR